MISLHKKDRKSFESKWNDIKVIIEYGMLSEDKFFEKYQDYFLYPTDDGSYLTMEELKKEIKEIQTDKDGKMVVLYSSNIEEQFSYIQVT